MTVGDRAGDGDGVGVGEIPDPSGWNGVNVGFILKTVDGRAAVSVGAGRRTSEPQAGEQADTNVIKMMNRMMLRLCINARDSQIQRPAKNWLAWARRSRIAWVSSGDVHVGWKNLLILTGSRRQLSSFVPR